MAGIAVVSVEIDVGQRPVADKFLDGLVSIMVESHACEDVDIFGKPACRTAVVQGGIRVGGPGIKRGLGETPEDSPTRGEAASHLAVDKAPAWKSCPVDIESYLRW
jgi:hypothetical protein